eukprot:Tbor_TRINITY_DN5187_c4_g2::TRINITY_DN5187_c4_g2_i1::g.25591::m.25591
MSHFDKSSHKGYDKQDEELNNELEEMLKHVPPKEHRKLQNRIHDGILQRMKEESTRLCFDFIQKYERCVNSVSLTNAKACIPHKDAMNDCVHDINSEEVYQKYRIAFLRGELYDMHKRRQEVRVEALKTMAPSVLPNLRSDYAPKYGYQMNELGEEPSGNIGTDDLKGEKFRRFD